MAYPMDSVAVITLPKKGNLQLCQNYRTISLISHSSKVMLKVILNRLIPQAEEIIKNQIPHPTCCILAIQQLQYDIYDIGENAVDNHTGTFDMLYYRNTTHLVLTNP